MISEEKFYFDQPRINGWMNTSIYDRTDILTSSVYASVITNETTIKQLSTCIKFLAVLQTSYKFSSSFLLGGLHEKMLQRYYWKKKLVFYSFIQNGT